MKISISSSNIGKNNIYIIEASYKTDSEQNFWFYFIISTSYRLSTPHFILNKTKKESLLVEEFINNFFKINTDYLERFTFHAQKYVILFCTEQKEQDECFKYFTEKYKGSDKAEYSHISFLELENPTFLQADRNSNHKIIKSLY